MAAQAEVTTRCERGRQRRDVSRSGGSASKGGGGTSKGGGGGTSRGCGGEEEEVGGASGRRKMEASGHRSGRRVLGTGAVWRLPLLYVVGLGI
jgi:hypothetical protein